MSAVTRHETAKSKVPQRKSAPAKTAVTMVEPSTKKPKRLHKIPTGYVIAKKARKGDPVPRGLKSLEDDYSLTRISDVYRSALTTVTAGTMVEIRTLINRGTPVDVIQATRHGLAATSIESISNYLDVPKTELFQALNVPRSTIESRIKGKQLLTAPETDKVLRIPKILERAAQVLEDETSAKKWLLQPVRSLGGVAPISLLDTEAGYELVLDTLTRIEHGVAA